MKARKHHPLRSLILSIGFSLLGQFSAPLHAAQPAEACAGFTDDGAWCWFADPRAVTANGTTYAGWITADGSVQVGALDHADGRVRIATLHEKYQRDDHDNPALFLLPDGRLRAFYSQHAGPEMNSRVTVRPHDISEWEEEVAVDLRDGSSGRRGITYPNPVMLSDEGNAIYMFWRGVSFKPTWSRSADGGLTWSPARIVVSRAGANDNNRPYVKIASNDRDRIHMVFTDGHPQAEATNSVYYACYRDGAFYKADGTRICGVEELPFKPEQADCVYDAKKSGARAWVWDVAFDGKDRPVVVYTRMPTGEDHRYHYAKWDGAQWLDTEICSAGKWFPQTAPGKKETQPYYSGGLVLDHTDPSVVYLSRPVNGVREIERRTTADGGKSWTSEAVTAGSEFDNVRPFVVRRYLPGGPTVLWMNLRGGYRLYTDYGAAIKMDRPAKTAITQLASDARTAAAPVEPGATLPPLSPAIEPGAVMAAMERVADWQLANPSRHPPTAWTQGAGYTGMMALAKISKNPKYLDAMLGMGEANRWRLGPRKFDANDHAVGQTYAELWLMKRKPGMLEPMRAQFDEILANPPQVASLDFKQKGAGSVWSWCDALFMGPPAWVRLWAATGERKYLDFAVANWWRTSDYLYDKEEHLYFRDSTFFDKREANGAKVFWSRGNGWVIGALVRILEHLPKDHPDRVRFETQFREMAAKLLACQQPDGLWRASLLDPAGYPLKETSGSAFFTYALAWGINEGLLDRATYEPAVRKAWAALVGCVAPDGKLTHVQPIGDDPKKFPEDATEVYGVGAFLLAGSEVYRLAGREAPDSSRPNVVVILADDWGFGDAACYDPEFAKIPTPNIDRLAREGMTFMDAHSSSSVCTPSRYSILTGRYNWRSRLQSGVLGVYADPLIAPDRLTVAGMLGQQGYQTAAIGKWHLGWQWPRRDGKVVFDQPIAQGPTTRGFDYYFGTDVPNYPPFAFIENDRVTEQPTGQFKGDKAMFLRHPGPMVPGWQFDRILPALVEKAVDFIGRRAGSGQPFFLYLALTTPHEPIAPSEQFKGKSGISPVGDLIMETDWAVGQVMDALAKAGIGENTILIFTSDNGHCPYTGLEPFQKAGHRVSGPFRGFKADAWDGGHHQPFIVRWPRVVKAGSRCDQTTSLTDIMATCADVTGAKIPADAAEDSFSLLPLLKGGDQPVRESVVTHSYKGMFSIQRGKWKLIVGRGSGGFKLAEKTSEPGQLYDLSTDVGETNNLYGRRPEIVAELTALLKRCVEEGRSTPGPGQRNDVPVNWSNKTPPAKQGGKQEEEPAS